MLGWHSSAQKPELVVQLGHSGAVTSAVFSPDGRLIVSNGVGGIIVWNSFTGSELRRIPGVFSAIDFAPDSRIVVASDGSDDVLSESEEKTRPRTYFLKFFDVLDGRLIRKFPAHKRNINSVKFSHDGRLILTASDDRTAKLWDATSGFLKLKLGGHKSEVSCAVFSPDDKLIAAAGVGEYSNDTNRFTGDATAIIWDLATAERSNALRTKTEQWISPASEHYSFRRTASCSSHLRNNLLEPPPSHSQLECGIGQQVKRSGVLPEVGQSVSRPMANIFWQIFELGIRPLTI